MDLGDLFKDLVFDQLIKFALSKLFAAVPVLAWGPIGWFVTYIVHKFADMLYDEMELHVKIQTVAFRNEKFEEEFRKSSIKLKLVSRDFGPGTSEFEEAKNEAKNDLSNVIRFQRAR